MSKGWAGHGQLSTTCRHQEMEDGQERPQGAGRIEGQPHPPRPTALWHGLLALPEMPASAMPVCPADHPGHKPSVPMNWGDHRTRSSQYKPRKSCPRILPSEQGQLATAGIDPCPCPTDTSLRSSQPRAVGPVPLAAPPVQPWGSSDLEAQHVSEESLALGTGLATQGTEAWRDIPAFPTGPHSCQSCAAPPPLREPAVVRGRPRVPSPRLSRSPRGQRVDLQPPVGNGIKATW